MRGFPLLRILSVAGVLLLLGVPVWMLTQDRVDAPGQNQAMVEVGALEDFIVVLTTSAPARLSVSAANHPLRASNGAVRRFETRLAMPASLPEDLVLSAEFDPGEGENALRAEVRVAGRLVAEKTFWGEAKIQDVMEIRAP